LVAVVGYRQGVLEGIGWVGMSGDPEYEGYVKPMAEPQPVPTCTRDFNIEGEGVCNQLVLLE